MVDKNKDNTKGVIVKRVSDKDLAAECRSAAKANFVYDRFIKPITYLGKVPDTYEDSLVVNDIALCKINSMEFSTVTIKFTRFNKLSKLYLHPIDGTAVGLFVIGCINGWCDLVSGLSGADVLSGKKSPFLSNLL